MNIKNLNKQTLLFIAFLDLLAIGIFLPILPDLTKYYGISSNLMSYSIVIYSFFAFISTPILGQLSDNFGRKKLLFLCITGSVISNLIMVFSTNYFVFLFARAINGITGGNMSILTSMMSDLSKDKNERIKNMGLIGSLFGIGFILGPIIGSSFAGYGVKFPFIFMSIASIIELILLLFFLKETHNKRIIKKINYNPLKIIFKNLKNKNIRLLVISLGVLLLSTYIYQIILSIFLAKQFYMNTSQIGYIVSFMGVVMVLNQSFLIRKFWFKFFSIDKLFIIIPIGIFILLTLLFFIKNISLFLITLFMLLLLQGLINPIYQSEIIDKTEAHSRGEIIGTMASVQSIAMIIGPLIGGFCIDKNISIFGVAAIIVFMNIFVGTINKQKLIKNYIKFK